MESKSSRKPINVLAGFLADWINANSEDAAPYDSFETIAPRRVGQKDVERWVFNCNYLYYRFGDFLFAHDLFGEDANESAELLAFLDANFKSIKDTNPLNLRSKQPEAIMREFSKDWPPLVAGSRSQLKQLDEKLASYAERYPNEARSHRRDLDAFAAELAREADWYASIAPERQAAARDLLAPCRELLPIWCLKEINPLYSLLIWNDEDAIAELAEQLGEAFKEAGLASYDGSRKHDSYAGLVRRAQQNYLAGLDDDLDLSERTVPELHRILHRNFFSLEHPAPSRELPSWLFGKSQLIWNVVVCSAFGPREALAGSGPARTATVAVAGTDLAAHDLKGEVLLRRRYKDGRLETVDSLTLGNVQASGLWIVIGSSYDENAALPASEFRSHYNKLGTQFIGTKRYDRAGNAVEGEGDSRFHAELSVSIDAEGGRHIFLRDLASKNGTCVIRQTPTGPRCLALSGKSRMTRAAWATRMGLDEQDVELVDEVALQRRDIIQLCGSCFELV